MKVSSSSQRKIATSRLAVIAAASLGALKLVVGLLTNTLSVTASAADSLLDLVVSSMNLFTLTVASRPPDADHRFGHGKAEGISAFFQGLVLAVVGVVVIAEAVRRLIAGTVPRETTPGILVMFFALIATVFLVRRMQKVASETQSLALAADARHYTSDISVNAGVITGLILYRITGFAPLDAIVSIGLALPILLSAGHVLKASVDDLMDRELPGSDRDRVISLIRSMGSPVLGYHGLRTRKSGSRRYVEVHLHVKKDVSFEEAHRLGHVLGKAIERELQDAHVTVHAEPVDEKGERVHAP
jgi:cation diffusion facilitator family transporter